MYSGGSLYVDSNSANTECTSTSTSDTTLSGPLSAYQSLTSDTISFFQSGGWSGTFTFRADYEATQIGIKSVQLDTAALSFEVILNTPTCFSPSTTPSLYPSLVPSLKPTIIPSITPSSAPSATPSKRPSTMPSGFPSQLPVSMPSLPPTKVPSVVPSKESSNVPSLLPRCVDEVVGKTYFFFLASFNVCVKIEVFTGGVVALDPNNTSCSKDDTDPSSLQIVSFFESATGTEILFQSNNGYSGQFVFVQDGSVMFIRTLLLDTVLRTFNGTIVLPSCTAPSSIPSSTLSSMPSHVPSLQPSSFPSVACQVENPSFLGDGICDDDQPGYYTEKCLWDHGDCDLKNATYPNCPGPLSWLTDCICDVQLNTTDCGYDGGDCLINYVNPNCTIPDFNYIGRKRHQEQKEKWIS